MKKKYSQPFYFTIKFKQFYGILIDDRFVCKITKYILCPRVTKKHIWRLIWIIEFNISIRRQSQKYQTLNRSPPQHRVLGNLTNPCKVSEPYNNPFWEKRYRGKKKKKEKYQNSGLPMLPRWSHALHSDQYCIWYWLIRKF